jgi:hypothetical protein
MAGEVDRDAVESVGDGGAGRATFLVVGPKHEMVDQELASALEKNLPARPSRSRYRIDTPSQSEPTAVPAAGAPTRHCGASVLSLP